MSDANELSKLAPPRGARKPRRRLGRGVGSDGRKCGKGDKGQRSRSGGTKAPGFEGGQMPLARRLPKRGFYNNFALDYAEVNVSRLERFEANSVVDADALKGAGVVRRVRDGIAVLGNGELTKPLTVRAKRFSKTAIAKIEAAGGKAERI